MAARNALGWWVLTGLILFPEKQREIVAAAGWQNHDWSEGDNSEAPQDAPTGRTDSGTDGAGAATR